MSERGQGTQSRRFLVNTPRHKFICQPWRQTPLNLSSL